MGCCAARNARRQVAAEVEAQHQRTWDALGLRPSEVRAIHAAYDAVLLREAKVQAHLRSTGAGDGGGGGESGTPGPIDGISSLGLLMYLDVERTPFTNKLFRIMDVDGDGCVDLRECVRPVPAQRPALRRVYRANACGVDDLFGVALCGCCLCVAQVRGGVLQLLFPQRVQPVRSRADLARPRAPLTRRCRPLNAAG